MKLYKNVYAISRDYGEFIQNDVQRKCLGLYEADTGNSIPEGNYYLYLKCIEEKYNYFWTGYGIRQIDKDRARHAEPSSVGSDTPIFGGYVDSHMGHFFIEVLARGIDFTRYKNHPVVFLLLRDRADLPTFYKYCAFFGLDKQQIIIVDSPIIFPKLYVPEPQFFITEELINRVSDSKYSYLNQDISTRHISGEHFSDKFLEAHRQKGDDISPEENTIDTILYLSCIKSKLYLGERIIHRALEEQGHTAICPEEHSWETVISLVRKHKHIVGLRGSAMHFLMFCRKKKKVTYYANTDQLSHNFHNLEQMLRNDMEYVQVRLTGIVNRPETNNLFVFEDIVRLLNKLGINNLPPNYHSIYKQVVVQNHTQYWQNRN